MQTILNSDSKFLDKISEHDAYILISLAKAVSEPHLSQPVEGLLNKFLITLMFP